MPKLELSQHQELSPYLLQSVQVLQMNLTELRTYIEAAFCENPMVDISMPHALSEQISINRILYYERSSFRRSTVSAEENADFLAQIPSNGVSLFDHLHNQLCLCESDPAVCAAADYIIGCLDRRGYLSDSPEDMARELALPLSTVEAALHCVQAMEPAGIAARSLAECLLLQLDRDGTHPIARQIVENHLEDLGRQRHQHIRSRLGISAEELKEACRLIHGLDPAPGALFDSAPTTQIIPDIQILTENGTASAQVRSDLVPEIRIHTDYLTMLENTSDPTVHQYLRENLHRAKTLISLVEHRQTTLERCARELVRCQQGFFLRGEAPAPMTMSGLAGKLEVNVSTVSRALRDKFLQCSRGVYPLSFFFSRALPAEDSAEGVSPEGIRTLLGEMIRSEDPRHPLSDQKLTDMLREKGIQAARRTVAKYRDELGFPTASGRRKT